MAGFLLFSWLLDVRVSCSTSVWQSFLLPPLGSWHGKIVAASPLSCCLGAAGLMETVPCLAAAAATAAAANVCIYVPLLAAASHVSIRFEGNIGVHLCVLLQLNLLVWQFYSFREKENCSSPPFSSPFYWEESIDLFMRVHSLPLSFVSLHEGRCVYFMSSNVWSQPVKVFVVAVVSSPTACIPCGLICACLVMNAGLICVSG